MVFTLTISMLGLLLVIGLTTTLGSVIDIVSLRPFVLYGYVSIDVKHIIVGLCSVVLVVMSVL